VQKGVTVEKLHSFQGHVGEMSASQNKKEEEKKKTCSHAVVDSFQYSVAQMEPYD
jgi:hypothetical protein